MFTHLKLHGTVSGDTEPTPGDSLMAGQLLRQFKNSVIYLFLHTFIETFIEQMPF